MAAPPALYFAGEPGYLKSEVFFLYYAILLQETLKLASVFVLLYYWRLLYQYKSTNADANLAGLDPAARNAQVPRGNGSVK